MQREALLSVGNGYFVTRGAAEESGDNDIHYPGTYLAGVYNRLESEVAGRIVSNEDLVNCPDWCAVSFKARGGCWLSPEAGRVVRLERTLDLHSGILERILEYDDPQERTTAIHSQRFASMADPHLACLSYRLTPENYSGNVRIRSALNGDISNQGVARYRQLASLHLQHKHAGTENGDLFLEVITNQSGITIAYWAVHRLFLNGEPLALQPEDTSRERYSAWEMNVELQRGDSLVLEKTVSMFTSRDENVAAPLETARAHARSISGELTSHAEASRAAWRPLWDCADLQVDGDPWADAVLRFHAYHLLITFSPHSLPLDVSVPARGLHGEAYRGHIFWDELFVLPFYELHFPDLARAILRYRCRRLDQARAYAREYGFQGAMFPWQSGSEGQEETQVVHLNPRSGEWGPDFSSLQRHVSLAVAYNIWKHVTIHNDQTFLQEEGAEVLLEIARFWSSLAAQEQQGGRFHIKGVMGPNEFHEKQAGNEAGGVPDNAYTNVLAAWLFQTCLSLLENMPTTVRTALRDRLALTDQELERWHALSDHLFLEIRDGIISQYQGFQELKELNWESYRTQYGDIGRMDRILKAEDKDPDDYQLSKQADLLMLFYLFPFDRLKSIFHNLDYPLDSDSLQRNFDYYLARTSHGSTLSLIVHAYIAALLGDRSLTDQWFRKSLQADLQDIQGGTTGEGIHTGLMAGTISLAVFAYGGLETSGERLALKPRLPETWEQLAFSIIFRNDRYRFRIEHQKVRIKFESEARDTTKIEIRGKVYTLNNKVETDIALA